jgi:hypothetical protein
MGNGFQVLVIILIQALICTVQAETRSAVDRLPEFSWAHVPRYMHIRKDTAFSADEIRYLASFPLVTFEKYTGISMA